MYIFLTYIINVCGFLRNRSQFWVFMVIYVFSASKLIRNCYKYLRSITSVKICCPVLQTASGWWCLQKWTLWCGLLFIHVLNESITQHRPRWPFGLVWGRSLSGVEGSNSNGGMDVRLLCLLCVEKVAACVTGWSLAQRSATGWTFRSEYNIATSAVTSGPELGPCGTEC